MSHKSVSRELETSVNPSALKIKIEVRKGGKRNRLVWFAQSGVLTVKGLGGSF